MYTIRDGQVEVSAETMIGAAQLMEFMRGKSATTVGICKDAAGVMHFGIIVAAADGVPRADLTEKQKNDLREAFKNGPAGKVEVENTTPVRLMPRSIGEKAAELLVSSWPRHGGHVWDFHDANSGHCVLVGDDCKIDRVRHYIAEAIDKAVINEREACACVAQSLPPHAAAAAIRLRQFNTEL